MLMGLWGAGRLDSTEPALNHRRSSKVNRIFVIAALWPKLNLSSEGGEKVQAIKSNPCTGHGYDSVSAGEEDGSSAACSLSRNEHQLTADGGNQSSAFVSTTSGDRHVAARMHIRIQQQHHQKKKKIWLYPCSFCHWAHWKIRVTRLASCTVHFLLAVASLQYLCCC